MRYGAAAALTRVSLEFRPAEIHALLGENGAGKTTLADALAGLVRPASGRVVADGTIGYVHQHFAIPPGLTSAETLLLEERGLRFLWRRTLHRRFREVETAAGLPLGDPDAVADALPVGARQRLELARAAWRRPDLLILDEPTAVLAPPEVEAFVEFVRGMARRGTAVLFITHKLPEAFLLADRLSLLRRGKLLFTRSVRETSPEEVAGEFLAGAGPDPSPPAPPDAVGEVVLAVRRLAIPGDEGQAAVSDLSLEVRAGEIVALAGVDGNGQRELAECIAGVRQPREGEMTLLGRRIRDVSFRRTGSSFVAGDRQREGLILDFSVEENLRLAEPIPELTPSEADELIRRYGIHAPSRKTPVRRLSGGNQQKVVLARELSRRPAFLLAVSPTRGLDLAAARMTRDALRAAARGGAAVLLVTADVEEARETADGIHVLYRGELSPRFPPAAPLRELGRAMAGLS